MAPNDDKATVAIVDWADVAQQFLGSSTGREAVEAVFSYLLRVTPTAVFA